jgi:hypothetical protein
MEWELSGNTDVSKVIISVFFEKGFDEWKFRI